MHKDKYFVNMPHIANPLCVDNMPSCTNNMYVVVFVHDGMLSMHEDKYA